MKAGFEKEKVLIMKEIIMESKGYPEDGYEHKIIEVLEKEGVEKKAADELVRMTEEALVEIEQKILDAIFVTELDSPLYIVAMEALIAAFNDGLERFGDMGEMMKKRTEQIRKLIDLKIITTIKE